MQVQVTLDQEEISSTFDNCRIETGYPSFVLEYLWNKYCGLLTPIAERVDLFR